MSIQTIYDWVTLRDYQQAKERATDQVVERLTRGNTLAQDGSAMEQDELDQLSRSADDAMRSLARAVG